ncbi:Hypothetical predicted protein [Xyrichtys novacula]|uniref:Uncharacterized protein n=1 Tax=Xyrichtys novacula TaxID=13765 RepID=A0AAV1HKZ7_XYRNO|nr:Hypothetical predicted protein [Xyrichtys novacula]
MRARILRAKTQSTVASTYTLSHVPLPPRTTTVLILCTSRTLRLNYDVNLTGNTFFSQNEPARRHLTTSAQQTVLLEATAAGGVHSLSAWWGVRAGLPAQP